MSENGSVTAPVSGRALDNLQGVTVAPQGLPGAQSDIQVRGSSFNGAGIAINGLALQNPQTEHFNGDMPLPPVLFGEPEVLSGLSMIRNTMGHLAGTINLDLRPVKEGGLVEAGVGEDGNNWQGGIVQTLLSETPEGQAGLSVFGHRETADGVDYSDNYLDRWNGGAHFQTVNSWNQTDFVLARQNRDFGARGYYGSPASRPSEESVDDKFLFAGSRVNYGDSFARISTSMRNVKDHYVLDRNNPAFYQNSHETDAMSAAIDGANEVDGETVIIWRGMFEDEALDSTNLGDHNRSRGGLTLLGERKIEPYCLTIGGRNYVFSDEGPEVVPLAGISRDIGKRNNVFVNYTQTIRQPSYTELYYHSVSSQGDETLGRSHARGYEAGYSGNNGREFFWQAVGFHREERNSVDWVWNTTSSKWQATDLGTVNVDGIDLSGKWVQSRKMSFSSMYSFLEKRNNTDIYASRYVLDYPKHSVSIACAYRIVQNCELSLVQAVRRQEANSKRDGDCTSTDGTAMIKVGLKRIPGAELMIACENIWNDDFEYLPGQPRGGRRVLSSVSYSW